MFVDRGGIPVAQDPAHEAWQVTLDRIELDVIRAERALATDGVVQTDRWDEPQGHGPIPPDLRDRAQSILDRQQALLGEFADRLGATARQQAVVDRVSAVSTRASANAVYVDVSV